MSEQQPPSSSIVSDEQKIAEPQPAVASQGQSIENIKADIKRVEDQIKSLDAKKLSDRLQKQTTELEQLQKQLDEQAKTLVKLLHLADQEANTPIGVISEAARMVPDIELEGGQWAEKFNKGVNRIARIIALVFWAVFGLYLWLPLILRSFIILQAQHVASAFTYSNMASARAAWDLAMGVYTYGFIQINRPFTHPPLDVDRETLAFGDTVWILSKELILSTLTYAVFFPFIRRWIISLF